MYCIQSWRKCKKDNDYPYLPLPDWVPITKTHYTKWEANKQKLQFFWSFFLKITHTWGCSNFLGESWFQIRQKLKLASTIMYCPWLYKLYTMYKVQSLLRFILCSTNNPNGFIVTTKLNQISLWWSTNHNIQKLLTVAHILLLFIPWRQNM